MIFNILTENRVKRRGLLAEHGLSVFIEYNGMNILFDTGQSDVYCHNAKVLGIDLKKTDCIVLSHGHYDHCGGFEYYPYKDKIPPVYVRKEAFLNKYALNPNKETYREIGIPWKLDDYKDNLVFTEAKTEIAKGVYLISEIPHTIDYEAVSSDLFTGNENAKITDTMKDEQMLVFDTEKGLVIFLGCSHPGIVNCISHAIKLFPNKKINTILAGMHLESVSSERLNKTIEFFKKLDADRIIPLHCTGIIPMCEIKRILKDKCCILCAGQGLKI